MSTLGFRDEQHLFLSSTFGDMQAERDPLRDVVLEDLVARVAREYSLRLLPIDLRWGVETHSRRQPDETAEQERTRLGMEVVRHCLDGIEQAQPFVVVIFGHRLISYSLTGGPGTMVKARGFSPSVPRRHTE